MPKSVERWAYVKTQLDSIGIDVERVDGVDVSTLSQIQYITKEPNSSGDFFIKLYLDKLFYLLRRDGIKLFFFRELYA